MMQYDLVHIVAICFVVFGFIWSGRLIQKYIKKYQQVELFWVAWLLVAVLIVGNKFI